ncbi:hypothetical protein HDV02_006496 [Globomyces sp. JEL0801]|nr:hypothetical protein HDV02_006496 [Globomyces sp. JEL0801]
MKTPILFYIHLFIVGFTCLSTEEWNTRLKNFPTNYTSQLATQLIESDAYGAAFFKLDDQSKLSVTKFYNGSCFDLNGKVKSTPNDNSLWRWASVTKMFTSASIFQLVEQGKVNLGEQVTKYLPWLSDKLKNRNLTVDDLLHHLIGTEDSLYLPLMPFPAQDVSMKDTIQKFWTAFNAPSGLDGGPTYSNLGIDILAAIVEEVGGQKFSDYLKSNIYDPLGTKSLGFTHQIDKSGKMDDICYSSKASKDEPYDVPSFGSAAMISNMDDMATFFAALLRNGDKIFKKNETSELFRKAPSYAYQFGSDGYRNGWEFQVYRGVDVWTKGGDLPGFQSIAFIIPQFNEGGVFSGTRSPGVRDIAFETYMNLTHPELLPTGMGRPLPSTKDTVAAAAKMAGNYYDNRNRQSSAAYVMSLLAPSYGISPGIDSSITLSVAGNGITAYPVIVNGSLPTNMIQYQFNLQNSTKTLTAVFDRPYSDSDSKVKHLVMMGQQTLIRQPLLSSLPMVLLLLFAEFLSYLLAILLGIFSIYYFMFRNPKRQTQLDQMVNGASNNMQKPKQSKIHTQMFLNFGQIGVASIAFAMLLVFVLLIINFSPFKTRTYILFIVVLNYLYLFSAIALLAFTFYHMNYKRHVLDNIRCYQGSLLIVFFSLFILGLIETWHLNWFTFNIW